MDKPKALNDRNKVAPRRKTGPLPVRRYCALVIGASTGGLYALRVILAGLPRTFPAAVMVVQHVGPSAEDNLVSLLQTVSRLPVHSPVDKQVAVPGQVFVAPPNYHLLVEHDRRLSLSVDERVSFSRPSIDVLFETAAEAYTSQLMGVLLTGANNDGTSGMRAIKRYGGLTIAQDPDSAEASLMPKSAVKAGVVDYIIPLESIAGFLIQRVGLGE